MLVQGVEIRTVGFHPDIGELNNYVDFIKRKVDKKVLEITVTLCADGDVDVEYIAQDTKFERIRRITGYLTGDLNTWNNAKRAEEHDRVKHL